VVGETFSSFPGETNKGSWDAFITRYDASGNQLWIRQFGTTRDDAITGAVPDGSGGVFLLGSTQGALPGQVQVSEVDAFIAHYDASGSQLSICQFGIPGRYATYSSLAALDQSGGAFLVGWIEGAFAGQTQVGGRDAFIARFSPGTA